MALSLAGTLLCALAGPTACAYWGTYHRDGLRSGVDPDSSSPVAPTQLWQTSPALDGEIYGQPLVYGSRVYVATENDSVYALDAATGAIVWQKSAGTPVPGNQLQCGDIATVGITSTPVIDPGTNRIFAVADTWDGSDSRTIQHRLVGFNLADGSVAPGTPLVADPPGSDPASQLQRAALALDAGKIVIPYGGNDGDCGTYHGWLVGAPETGGSLLSYEVDSGTNDHGGAIWGAGNGPAVDSSGDIWAATGNGYSGSNYDGQESVLKLDANLNLLDHWAPSNWQALDNSDQDMGSSEPLRLPGGLVFQIGKTGVGYLLSAPNLGGTGASPLFQAGVCGGSYGGSVYFAGVIYVTCADGLHALSLDTSTPSFSALSGWSVNTQAIGPPIIAGGLVWSIGWANGVLYGLNPNSGSTTFSQSLGGFDHFASPSAAGGRLFVANGSKVTAFTIATPPPQSRTIPAPGSTANPLPPSATTPPQSGKAPHVVRYPPVISTLRRNASREILTLTLSKPAQVTIVITRTVSGRRVNGRCRTNRKKGKPCALTLHVATLRFTGRRGLNSFRLPSRELSDGRYTATLTARDATGLLSKRHTLEFAIKAPKKR